VALTNVELVETALHAWNAQELDAFGAHVADDVVWLEVSGWLESEGAELRGKAKLLSNLGGLLEAWESYHLELEEIHDGADTVVAVVRETGRGRASGVEVDSLWGYVFTIANGKLARVEAYRDPDQALQRVR
jgi:ketosteroid isomerase-like protein